MKKLKNLFGLISIFTLCTGMTLLMMNKTNVKAQEGEISATVYLPIPSGFYLYDYDQSNPRLYFLYNTVDNGGFHYNVIYNFNSRPETGPRTIITSMKLEIESTPRIINEDTSIKTDLIYKLTLDLPFNVIIRVRDFWVYDVSSWFEQLTSYNLFSIQLLDDEYRLLYINNIIFSDLQDLAETQLILYGTDISYAIYDNIDADATVYYNNGWNAGYNEGLNDGYDNGHNDGYDLGYDDGYNIGFDDGQYSGYNIGYVSGYEDGYGEGFEDGKKEVHSPTPTEYFLYEFNNWIIPAIAIVVIGGGIFALFIRKREV